MVNSRKPSTATETRKVLGLAEVFDWVNEYWQEIQTMPLDYLHKE